MSDHPDIAPSEADELDDLTESPGPDGDPDADPDGADALGEPGKRALDAMKAKWRAERERRRIAETELSELRARADAGAPDVEAVRREAERAATARANERIVRAEVRAAATGLLTDPGDALRFLDLDRFAVGADGDVNTEEITEAIGDLLTTRPYLAAHGGRRFQGTGDGGARTGTRPSQITSRTALARMSPAERLKAHADGRLRHLLHGE